MEHWWKNIASIGFVIVSLAMLVHAIHPALATLGPQVSLGSNPIAHFYKNCNGLTNAVFFQNATNMDFIITDILVYNGGVRLFEGNGTPSNTLFVGGFSSYTSSQQVFDFVSGLVVPAGNTVYCSDEAYYPEVTISGYYAHP